MVCDERGACTRTIRLKSSSSKVLSVSGVLKKYAKYSGEAVDGLALQHGDGRPLGAGDRVPETVFVVSAPGKVAAPRDVAEKPTEAASKGPASVVGLRYDESVMDRVHVSNLMRHAMELGALVAPIALNATMATRPREGPCWFLDMGSGLGEPACTLATHDRSARVVGVDTHAPRVTPVPWTV